MPKYRCDNEACENFGKEITELRARITIVNSTAHDRNDWCPVCKQRRLLIREPGMTTMVYGTDIKTRRT